MISNISTTEKIRTAQILGDLIEYTSYLNPELSKNFKIRRSGTELHGTSQSFGGKFLPSLPDSPGLFRRSGASAPSAPISLFPSKSTSIAVCFMASTTTCRSETAPPRCRGCAVRVELEITGAKYVPAMYVIQLLLYIYNCNLL